MQRNGAFIKVFVSKPKIQKYMNIREKYRHAYTEVGVVTKNLSYRVSTTSRLGIKQLGVSLVVFFFYFPMKVARGHVHGSRGKSLAPPLNDTPERYR